MVVEAPLVVCPGPASSPLLSMPRTQFTRFCNSVLLVAPNAAWQAPFPAATVDKSNRESAPAEQVGEQLLDSEQVRTLRSELLAAPVSGALVRYCPRNCCAAPPFSTTSPSGPSVSVGSGEPRGELVQKSTDPAPHCTPVVGFSVQRLHAVGTIKPVLELTASLFCRSTSVRAWLPVS